METTKRSSKTRSTPPLKVSRNGGSLSSSATKVVESTIKNDDVGSAEMKSKAVRRRNRPKRTAKQGAADDHARNNNDGKPSVMSPLAFALLRGGSSLCFLPAHFYAMTQLRSFYARWGVCVIFFGSMLWNNLAFALPQTSGIKIPLQIVVLASAIDGFGMTASSVTCICWSLGLAEGPNGVLRGCRPWLLTAVWSVYEYFLMVRSQRPLPPIAPLGSRLFVSGWEEGKRPRFIGYDGKTLVKKLLYPLRVNVVRSAIVLLSILLCARHMVRTSQFLATATMLAAAAVGYVTYIGNGLDRDFDIRSVWIWHGCIGVFAIHEINCMAAFGA